MKNNVKIILMMLCIGISVNLSGMNPFGQSQKNIINNLYSAYTPTYNANSKEGIAATWAQALVSRLSDTERAALIYECINLPANTGANNAWVTRSALSLIAAYKEMGKNMAAGWTNWIISKATKAVSYVLSPFTRAYSYFMEYQLPLLDAYLQSNINNAYVNGQFNQYWFDEALNFAEQDFQNFTTFAKLKPEQQKNKDAQIQLILDKLMYTIDLSAANNNVPNPGTKEQIKNKLDQQWVLQQPIFTQPAQ